MPKHHWTVNEGKSRTRPLAEVLEDFEDQGLEIFALLPITEGGETTITIVARKEDPSALPFP